MLLIRNASIVNEGEVFSGDVLIENDRIVRIGSGIAPAAPVVYDEIDATGLHLFPGCIDDQVHFREPGLTHKANIYTESRAAVAGGVTSFMEMPNTIPNALTQQLLQEKYDIAASNSPANYSFYMGVSNDNSEEVLKTDPENVCGIKIFMGSSTGNMLVDNEKTLDKIFSSTPLLIATHCEDEVTVKANLAKYMGQFGEDIPVSYHPIIRSEEACYLSSSFAVSLAKKHNTRLHVLHISTKRELELFTNNIPVREKRITSEACIHHLWFTDKDYETKGNLIKWNPAVKTSVDRAAIREAIINGTIDVIATDHAPHTLEEKQQNYIKAPSGGPLVQHSLLAMIDLHHEGWLPLPMIAQKMAHDVADCFRMKERGYIREGYFADLVLVDLKAKNLVNKASLLYKCGWSPFEGHEFRASISRTLVNGKVVYENGTIVEGQPGMRLSFERDRF